MDVSSQAEKANHPPCFCSVQALNGLDDLHFGEGKPLFSLQIRMLISSRNTFNEAPRNKVFPSYLGISQCIKLAHKINHHKD